MPKYIPEFPSNEVESFEPSFGHYLCSAFCKVMKSHLLETSTHLTDSEEGCSIIESSELERSGGR